MRTDSRDRFGTPLEKRLTKNIYKMIKAPGLINIKFKKDAPFWTVVAYKKR